jgi:hypothetical protein
LPQGKIPTLKEGVPKWESSFVETTGVFAFLDFFN